MKKWFKKVIATVLTVTVALTATVPAFAEDSVQSLPAEADIYSQQITETINFDGINYTYQYYYDENGNRTINILNEETGAIDVVTFNDATSQVYENGTVVATFEAIESLTSVNVDTTSSSTDDWLHIAGPDTTRITWDAGTVAAVVAASIAAGIGATVSYVVAAIGATAIATFVASCTGGTLTVTLYKLNTNLRIQYKYVWSFLAGTGDRYGDYEYLTNTNIYV